MQAKPGKDENAVGPIEVALPSGVRLYLPLPPTGTRGGGELGVCGGKMEGWGRQKLVTSLRQSGRQEENCKTMKAKGCFRRKPTVLKSMAIVIMSFEIAGTGVGLR